MWFHRKGNKMYGVVFDCGTSSVRAALFSYASTDTVPKPEVLQVIRMPFEASAYMDAHTLKRKTVESLRRIVREFPHAFQPNHIFIGLSSPFYASKTMRMQQRRERADTPITLEELRRFLKDAEDAFAKEEKQYMEGEEVILFTSRILKTYINGYLTADPVGTRGAFLELLVHLEATTNRVRDDIKTSFADRFISLPVHFISTPLASFYALYTVCDAEAGFLVIDIGGEVSDISLTVHGVLERISTLPLGGNALLRQVAAFIGVSLQDAVFIVRRYAEHALDDSYKKRISPLLAEFQSIWRKQLRTVLTRYAEQYEIPSRVLLMGGGILPFHITLFSEEAMNSFMFQKQPVVSVAAPSLLDTQFLKQSFNGPADFSLASLVLLGAKNGV